MISSVELFDMLYEKNKGFQLKPEEAVYIIEHVFKELLYYKKSGFLSYCISIWNNSCRADKRSVPIDLREIKSFLVDGSSIYKGNRFFGTRDAYIWITMLEIYLISGQNKYRVADYYAKNRHQTLNRNSCNDDEGAVYRKILNINRLMELYLRRLEASKRTPTIIKEVNRVEKIQNKEPKIEKIHTEDRIQPVEKVHTEDRIQPVEKIESEVICEDISQEDNEEMLITEIEETKKAEKIEEEKNATENNDQASNEEGCQAQAIENNDQAKEDEPCIVIACEEKSDEAEKLYNEAKEKALAIIKEAENKARGLISEAENRVSEAEKRASAIIERAYENAREIRDEALLEKEKAEAYIKEQRELIEGERREIISRLEEEGNKYIGELRECSLQRQDENNEHYQIDRENIKEGVTRARVELNKISGQLNQILESVQLSSKEDIFRQYSYLYDSIYNVYSYLIKQSDVQSLKLCNNLTSFMEIIEENLAEYGILTIKTEKNSPFQGKYHKVVGNVGDFNPKTAYVTRSLKSGFIWDDVVKEKELVEIIDASKND